MRIEIKVDDREIRRMLERLKTRGRDLTPAMESIGELIRTSVEKNFAEQGRPDRWPESRRVQREGGQTLSDTGRLRRSFSVDADYRRVRVGTNVKYAAIHQLGFTGTMSVRQHVRGVKSRDIKSGKKKVATGIGYVRAHSRRVNITERPFLMIQDEDRRGIIETLKQHLLKTP